MSACTDAHTAVAFWLAGKKDLYLIRDTFEYLLKRLFNKAECRDVDVSWDYVKKQYGASEMPLGVLVFPPEALKKARQLVDALRMKDTRQATLYDSIIAKAY